MLARLDACLLAVRGRERVGRYEWLSDGEDLSDGVTVSDSVMQQVSDAVSV